MSYLDDLRKKALNTLRDALPSPFSGKKRKQEVDDAIEKADPPQKKKTTMRKRKVRTLRAQFIAGKDMRAPKKVPNKQAQKKAALAKHTQGLKTLISTPVKKKRSLRD